ncbi:CocE/NonD family hydrolase [Haloechinothrix salitolerans]|uniref:CocE/NonD family hydrolase n=1 Tax=Haloechinothrix salitolerans TaxID=926830 RepID=A0ABW2C325_9PSEU
MTSMARRWRTTALGFGAAILLAATTATAPTAGATPATHAPPNQAYDYTETPRLSEDRYETVKETFEIPMHDGVEVYVEVTKPKQSGEWPVVMEASPYHGTLADREGTRILPEPRDENGNPVGLTGYFAPKGYAVVIMDLRGTGLSGGCLDHLGPNDAKDLENVVEWAASQDWSNGRVGMTGHSYVGSTPSLAAAVNPDGLETIVPSAGLATMYDHQFQAGVPYFLQWVGPMFAYEQIALERHLPGGESFGKNQEDTGCGLPNTSLTAGEAQLSGEYTHWHAERDWRAEAAAADLPVFMVHGVNDNAARVAGMEWFTERGGREGDKLWLGQWDHGSGCCPTRRGIQWTYALHAWFDKHLMQRNVKTGPDTELFLSDGTFEGARTGDRTEIHVDSQWPPASARMLELYPTADGALSDSAPMTPGSASFAGDPSGFTDPQGTGGVEFATEPLEQDVLFGGQPQLDLVASVTTPRVHLIANLYDESPPAEDGTVERRRISQFAINPELRSGLSTPAPVLPGVPYEMEPPGFAMAHDLRAGHRLVMRVTMSDPDKVPTFATDPQITVMTGPDATALRVPVVTDPALVTDDVPFELDAPEEAGTPQPTQRTSVTPALGGPERTEATVAYYEFDVEEDFDNANLIVGAVPSMPADIDLYVQRQQADGTWGDDLASGTSGSLSSEQLRMRRPEPGHYRVEVHNWLGAPATRVDLTLTFLNSAGEPGEGA